MSDHEEDRSTTTADSEDTPSPVVRTKPLFGAAACHRTRSPFPTTCGLGAQAFERWQTYSQRSYDPAFDDDAAVRHLDEHYDPIAWPPRITFQESQLRSTS
jgi:hypothetical protein